MFYMIVLTYFKRATQGSFLFCALIYYISLYCKDNNITKAEAIRNAL